MPKLGFPSLVRYSTVNADEGLATRLVRPRTLIYAVILTTITLVFAQRIGTRQPLELTVNRSPGTLYATDPDGAIRNTFLVHVTNNDPDQGHLYVISIHGLEGGQMAAPPIDLAPLGSQTVPLTVRVPEALARRTSPFTVRVAEIGTNHQLERDATFKAPEREEER